MTPGNASSATEFLVACASTIFAVRASSSALFGASELSAISRIPRGAISIAPVLAPRQRLRRVRLRGPGRTPQNLLISMVDANELRVRDSALYGKLQSRPLISA